MSPELSIEQKLNLETAKIGWPELERFFAQGLIIAVDNNLDLLQVAALFARDNSDQVGQMLSQDRVRKADSSDAKRWHCDNSEFWAVVVAPWILVQEIQ